MKNKSFFKRTLSLSLCLIILLNIVPMKVIATNSSVPGAEGHILTDIITGTFEGGQDSTIFVYSTPNAYSTINYKINDNSAIFEIPSYDSEKWYFDGWRTWYKGSLLGLGVTTSDKANPKFSDDLNYFEVNEELKIFAGEYYNAGSMSVYKEDSWQGTYYLSAIFKPIINVNIGTGAEYTFSGATSLGNNKYGVTYGNDATINYNITDNKYIVSNISASFGTSYSEENSKIRLSGVVRPGSITIYTRLKQQKVSFDANGGTGTMEQQTFNSGEEKPLTANSFTRYKYEFIGWNTKADGTGTNYAHTGNVVFNPTNDGENITLYAQWERLPNANYTAPTANDLTYNTQEQGLITKGTSNDGVFKYSLEENGVYDEIVPTAKNAGTYTVWYYVEGDNNHNDSNKKSVEVEIKKANPDIGTVSANDINDTTDISALVLKRTNENVEGELIFDENQSLNLGENIINYEFIPDDTSNYNVIDGQVSVTVKDTVSPTGTVKFADIETVWDEIPGTITFDMYFKNNQKIIVTATDSFSGVDKIEYYETDGILDLEGLKLITEEGWNLVEGDVNIPVEDGKQFIYYIRITDKSGNIGYIATNGAEFDTTAPTISGVYDGKTYYTSQKVTVTDKNLDTVTLNGEIVTDTIILEGNKEATYTIVATDKVGNSTTVTVKMAVSDDINENTNKLNNPTTGDNIGKYFTMFIVSILGISAIILRKRKRTK